jgi:hypothetical protein
MISQFRERYVSMSDEELAALALTGELVEEARLQLDAELRSRGIKDLASFRRLAEEDDEQLLEHYKHRFEKHKEAAYLRFKVVVGGCILLALIEILNWHQGRHDSVLSGFMVMGGIIIFYWIYLKLRLTVAKKLLNPFLWKGRGQAEPERLD